MPAASGLKLAVRRCPVAATSHPFARAGGCRLALEEVAYGQAKNLQELWLARPSGKSGAKARP